MTSRFRFAAFLILAQISAGACVSVALSPHLKSPVLLAEWAAVQNQSGPSLTADDELKFLTARLNLSQDQQIAIKNILENQHFQAQTINNDQALSWENKMEKLKDVNEVTVSKINDVLHNNQKDEFAGVSDEMRVHIGKGHGSGYGKGSGSGRGSGMSIDDQVKLLSSKLPLSSEQQVSTKVILEEQHMQIQAIWKDSSLSSQDKAEKLHALGEATVARVRALLRPEQQKQFDESQQDMYEIIARGNNQNGAQLH